MAYLTPDEPEEDEEDTKSPTDKICRGPDGCGGARAPGGGGGGRGGGGGGKGAESAGKVEPVTQGRGADVYEAKGKDARGWFDEIIGNSGPATPATPASYLGGEMVTLPGGISVGIRVSQTSGPTLDINIPGLPGNSFRIHFP